MTVHDSPSPSQSKGWRGKPSAETFIFLNPRRRPTPPDDGAHLTRIGAEALARSIQRYWHARGYHGIECWVEDQSSGRPTESDKDDGSPLFAVRSNMLNGYPPKEAPYEPTAAARAA